MNRFMLLIALTLAIGTVVHAAGSSEGATGQAVAVNRTGFPITDVPVTLRVFTPQKAGFAAHDEMPFLHDLEERSNIQIDWMLVPSQGLNERRNLLLASGDYPDVFLESGLTPLDEVNYGEQRVLLRLNELIDEWTDSISGVLDEYAWVRDVITTPNGSIYSLPSLVANPHVQVMDKMWINRAWLAELGLEVPTTTEEPYEVLTAFKNQDPNGNGRSDEIPFSILEGDFGSLFGSWGVLSDQQRLMVRDGEVVFAPVTSEYREGLRFFHRLYSEGLLDEEVFTQDITQLRAKGRSESQLIGLTITNWIGSIVGDDRLDDFQMIPPFEGPAGDRLWNRNVNFMATPGQVALTSVNPNPEATMRWLDYAYSGIGSMEFRFGREDVTWFWNADQKWEFTTQNRDELDSLTRQESPTTNLEGFFMFENKAMDDLNVYLIRLVDRHYAPYWPDQLYPRTYFERETLEQLNILKSGIETYVDQMMARFITGDVSIEAGWDRYLQSLDNMGLEELVGIYQSGLDAIGDFQIDNVPAWDMSDYEVTRYRD